MPHQGQCDRCKEDKQVSLKLRGIWERPRPQWECQSCQDAREILERLERGKA